VAEAAVAGRARLLALATIFVGGTALGAAVPTAFNLAGRYTHSFPNGSVDGGGYTSTDEVVIVPIDARRALIDIHLFFYNGHQCNISGLARMEGDALVTRDSEMTGYGEGGPCVLRVRRSAGRIAWDDQGTCSGYCGARGTLRTGGIAWSSRRPVPPAERRRILRHYERNRTRP
jgi:hypothetical protein